jgi:hypothetical protein
MATEGELSLGNLSNQDFDEIWNGPNARDLRRAHFTWDYPSLCKSCRLTDLPPAKSQLPFVHHYVRNMMGSRNVIPPTLALERPTHMARLTSGPTFLIRTPVHDSARYVVIVALGGEMSETRVFEAEPHRRQDGTTELCLAEDIWTDLETNLGYWWTVIGLGADGAPEHGASEIRCLVRHEDMPRIAGSTLGYPDEGHIPATYLGGQRQIGWDDRETLPVRLMVTPPSAERHNGKTARRASRDHLASYDEHLRRLRKAAGA